MQPQEQARISMIENARNTAYVLMFVADGLAMSVEMLLHRRWGSRAIGGRALLALALMAAWPAIAYPASDPRPQWWMIGLFLFRCFFARLSGAIRAMNGWEGHSRYNGSPIFKWLAPRCSEAGFKRVGEPLIVVAAAVVISPHSEMLAAYLLLAAVGLFLSVAVAQAVERARMQDLRDAAIEQRWRAQEFDRMYRDIR